MTQINNLFFILQHQPFEVEVLPNPEAVKLIVGDLFCGAGGTSQGFVEAKNEKGHRTAVVAFAVNHDVNAVKSHALNHPKTKHFLEDVRTLNVYPLLDIIKAYKKVYVNAEFMLWASAPCQEHSIAKAGKNLDVSNRTLPNDIIRYIEILKPDRIGIENVRQFKDWGPLMAAKKKTHRDVQYPYTELKTYYCKKDKVERIQYKVVPERKGEFFHKWRRDIIKMGYEESWTFINAADMGAYTSRDRLFGQFCKPNLKIKWPVPTHDKHGRNGLQKWKKAEDILELDNHGESIFNRKKRLSPNTIRKILEEIKKTVSRGDSWHIHKYYGSGINMTTKDDPIGTLRRKDCMYYIKLVFHQYGTSYSTKLNECLGAITANPKGNVISFLFDGSFGGSIHDLKHPVRTIVAGQNKAPLEKLDVVQVLFNSDISNFILEDDLRYIKTGMGEKSVYLDMIEFCVLHGIRDILKRGLTKRELLLAQGFPGDYKFSGCETEIKMYIGNSVSPVPARALAETICLN